MALPAGVCPSDTLPTLAPHLGPHQGGRASTKLRPPPPKWALHHLRWQRRLPRKRPLRARGLRSQQQRAILGRPGDRMCEEHMHARAPAPTQIFHSPTGLSLQNTNLEVIVRYFKTITSKHLTPSIGTLWVLSLGLCTHPTPMKPALAVVLEPQISQAALWPSPALEAPLWWEQLWITASLLWLPTPAVWPHCSLQSQSSTKEFAQEPCPKGPTIIWEQARASLSHLYGRGESVGLLNWMECGDFLDFHLWSFSLKCCPGGKSITWIWIFFNCSIIYIQRNA